MKENITTNNDLKNKSLDKGLNKKTKTSARKVKKKLGMGLSSLLSKDQELASVIRTKIKDQVKKSPLKIEMPKLSKKEDFFIKDKIKSILKWIKDQSELTNEYLWGGTLGPNFDCSGLIQTAFLKHHIHIPRDSYQIKSFCKHLFYFKESYTALQPGDLLFFGNEEKCDHIGIYKGDGFYYHSSGRDFGRNGIGLDTLKKSNDKISLHYKSKLISAGRVVRNYRLDRTIR